MDNHISSQTARDELEAPVVLTPDQIAAVAGGTAAAVATTSIKNGGATMGIILPPTEQMRTI
jgi:hypothetical protein